MSKTYKDKLEPNLAEMSSGVQREVVGNIPIIVEFSGGLEILFSNKRRHDISIPASMDSGKRPNITYLLRHLVDNVIKDERKELFVLDGHLRPGILALINDTDWELEGEENYEIQPGDNILFVSTLHGG